MFLDIEHSLLLPHNGEDLGVNKLLRASLRRKGRTGVTIDEQPQTPPWSPEFFLLDQSDFYRKLSSQQQTDVLKACNEFVLGNSYFIEKAGIAYAAKMILLAESTEVRQIYGLIASDEAVHLEWLSPFVKEMHRTTPQGNFIQLISNMIAQCDANALFYLVQTILEGWGIFYYKTLSNTCQKPDLQQAILNIVKDEALHHQTGVALFDVKKMDKVCENKVHDGILGYIDNLRAGPQDIIRCIETALGQHLSTNQLALLFEELQTEQTSIIKINILKGIMHHPFIENFIATLEVQGSFKPYTPLECAQIFSNYRPTSY